MLPAGRQTNDQAGSGKNYQHFFQCLRSDPSRSGGLWARHNINVNAIGPGPTITELNRQYFEDNPADLQERIDSIPMARVGDPQDLVGAALLLAGDGSNYITGQTLLVDGGSTIW